MNFSPKENIYRELEFQWMKIIGINRQIIKDLIVTVHILFTLDSLAYNNWY